MRTLTTLLLVAAGALAACATLPDPYLAPEGSETAATVDELAPGRYHVLVRINYFAADGEAERLLRKRAATLCKQGEAVHIDHLATARQPAMAAADITCEAPQAEEPPIAEPAPDAPADTDNGVPSSETAPPAPAGATTPDAE